MAWARGEIILISHPKKFPLIRNKYTIAATAAAGISRDKIAISMHKHFQEENNSLNVSIKLWKAIIHNLYFNLADIRFVC